MTPGRHGAVPAFRRPDNREEALIAAASEAGVSVAVARQVVATFLARWSGPYGAQKLLTTVAAEIAGPPA